MTSQINNPGQDAVAMFDRLPDTAFVRLPTVRAVFAVSRATVWRWSKPGGQIPAPRQLGGRVTGWNVGELRSALASLNQSAVA